MEEEITVFGDDLSGTPLFSGTGRVVTGVTTPAVSHSSCRNGGLSCIVMEFLQQGWTNIQNILS
jgi:hypothetical protein